MVRDGWHPNNTSIPILKVEERPPSLTKQLVNQRFEPIQFLQHVLSSSITVNRHQTSFIELLQNTLNINMISRHPGKETSSLYREVTEVETYKILAIKLMQGLETRGKTKHVDRGLYEEVQNYLGINRAKV